MSDEVKVVEYVVGHRRINPGQEARIEERMAGIDAEIDAHMIASAEVEPLPSALKKEYGELLAEESAEKDRKADLRVAVEQNLTILPEPHPKKLIALSHGAPAVTSHYVRLEVLSPELRVQIERELYLLGGR